MTKRTNKRCLLQVISAAVMAFIAIPLYAIDADFTDGITVDSTLDAPDLVIDGACDDGAGNCTLRAAIMEANANPGADTIMLPAGTYTLTVHGVDERCDGAVPCGGDGTAGNPYTPVISADASVGDLDITDDLTLTGDGPDVTTVQWGAAPLADDNPLTGDRIFHIQTTTTSITNVTIEGLTLRNGESGLVPTGAKTVCTEDPLNPGTFIYDPAALNAYDIRVTNDTCGSIAIWQFRRMGGAIALGAGYSVVLYEETVHGPGGGAVGGGGGGGGGGEGGPFPGGKPGEDDTTTIGDVTLNNVVVVGNWSGADGGGIFGGVTSQISNAIITGNTSGANGGGIYVAEPASIIDTTIGSVTDAALQHGITGLDVGNAAENGGGIFDTGSHTTMIARSAINGNTAIGGGGIAGRAKVTIMLANSTLSTNVATDVGGGMTTNGTINLRNVSVVNNSSSSDAPGGGGGLNAFGPGVYNISNTLLAGNTKESMAGTVTSNCGCSGGSPTCGVGVINSAGWNLEDADTCGLTALDLTNTDPLLNALANNGGPSETHSMLANSPAIDAGDPNACLVLVADLGLDSDQRGAGFGRSVDGKRNGTAVCDIGALELEQSALPPSPPADDNGGFCSYNPNGKFDPLMPAMLLLSLTYLGVSHFRARNRVYSRK